MGGWPDFSSLSEEAGTRLWQNVAISSTTWQWARSVHNVISSHMTISVEILKLFFPHFKFQVE